MEKNSNIRLVQHNLELGLTTATGQRHGCRGHRPCPKGGGSHPGALTSSMGQGTAVNAALKPGCKPGLAKPRQGWGELPSAAPGEGATPSSNITPATYNLPWGDAAEKELG